ncbi:sulfocyanin-like copper-binding protein [Sulfobacillus thermosulfidooxidans]|uniref:sulfocyanin-like copper-binding protein n=1 Tax=Sulfobacillus thermosulfidooxidans TaxID=28034 RepID=UPI0006B63B3C|nr:sulfocyanin-like copper-binding protein [Sulfobacillus thermosulfidooxidans]
MPYSLLNYINPVTIHTFYVSLFQATGVILLLVLLGVGIRHMVRKNPNNLGSETENAAVKDSPQYPRGYNILWWGLGILWLIDGLLQAQPPMATSMFVDMDVATNVTGQPHWLLVLLGAGIQAWTDHQIASAVFAVLIQMFIGVGILLGYRRPLGRIALYVSLLWSIPVWIYGEGLGNLFASGASWLTGTPGAVIFYITGAIWLLLPPKYWTSGKIAEWTRYLMAGIWLLLAFFQALPGSGYWSSQGLYNVFRYNTLMPQPAILLDPITWAMHQSSLHPVLFNSIIVAVMAYLGVMMLIKRTGKLFWTVTVLWIFASWWLGQDFGIVGGVGTDPQAAPLALLMMVGGWWYARKVESNRPQTVKPLVARSMVKKLGWVSTSVITAVFLLFGFAIPQVVVAQGDKPAPTPHYRQAASPTTFNPHQWMQFNTQAKTVHLLLEASVNRFGSLAFDGYANGFMTITIPKGWTVDATFINEQVLLKNSAMIVPFAQLQQGGPFTPAFQGATSPNPITGANHGVVQHFHFVASQDGKYAVVSAVPDGQSDSGMWAYFLVENVSKPKITVK